MNYPRTLFVCGLALILTGVLDYFYEINACLYLAPVLYLAIKVAIGSANIQSNFFTSVLCSGATNKNQIALTFDDGPDGKFTAEILQTLESWNTKATFFIIGKNIRGNEGLIRKIDADGHLTGNHTFSHSFFIDFRNKASFIDEMKRTSDLIFNITGKRTRLFRPPYGVTTPAIAKACKSLEYDIVGWNVRSLDTTNDAIEKITRRVISQIKPGAILLFHDTSHKTNQVLTKVLQFVKQNGIEIVPLNELLNIKAYH